MITTIDWYAYAHESHLCFPYQSTLKIYTVAEMVGYTDVANFSRNFKKIIGKTPGEYRDSEG